MPEPSPIAPASTQDAGQWTPEMMNLIGTLLSGQLSGSSQAELDQQQAQVHQQASDAAQASDQAAQAYTDQTNQPQEQPNNFYDQLLGNTASVLSGNKDYSHQASERLAQHGRELDAARMQNLQSLKAAAENKASIAEKLGNAEVAGKARISIEKYHAKMKAISDAAKQFHEDKALNTKGGQAIDQIHTRGDEARKTKIAPGWVKPGTSAGVGVARDTAKDGQFESSLTKTDFGSFIDIQKYTAPEKPALRAYAAEKGAMLLDTKQASAILDMETSWATLKSQADQVYGKLADGPGDRLWQAGKNLALMKSGADPVLGAFDSMWANTVRTMRAQAGAGGLRINKSEIERAIKLDRPNPIWDTKPILDQKMKNWALIRAHAISPLMSGDWRSIKPGGTMRIMSPDGSVKTVKAMVGEAMLSKRDSEYSRVLDESDFPGFKTGDAITPLPTPTAPKDSGGIR